MTFLCAPLLVVWVLLWLLGHWGVLLFGAAWLIGVLSSLPELKPEMIFVISVRACGEQINYGIWNMICEILFTYGGC